MDKEQPDLFLDYLPRALARECADGLQAFEIHCRNRGLDPTVDCPETRAAHRLVWQARHR